MKNLVTLDCESYLNYFLTAFKNIDTGSVITISARGLDARLDVKQLKTLNYIMRKRRTFGFNSRNYDIPVIMQALSGASCSEINQMSDYIIENNSQGWMTMQRFDLVKPDVMRHFDIQEPSPGVMVSLKLYGGRLHSEKLQDLPIEPGVHLTEEQMDEIEVYCINDLDTNIDLYNEIKDRIDLRVDMSKQYNQDLMSKSDAQIAEAVIKSELVKMNGKISKPKIPEGTTYRYNVPDFIKFKSEDLNTALDIIKTHDFELDGKGSIKLPNELEKLKIEMGSSKYQLGIGGLHSTEKKQAIIPTDNQILADRDVAAYYPNIILNLGLYPKHLGESFLDVYKNIVEERLRAKGRVKEIDKEIKELEEMLNGISH